VKNICASQVVTDPHICDKKNIPRKVLKKPRCLTRQTLARRDAPSPKQGRRRVETGSLPSEAHGPTNKEHQVCARRRDVRRQGPLEDTSEPRTMLTDFSASYYACDGAWVPRNSRILPPMSSARIRDSPMSIARIPASINRTTSAR